MTHAEIMITIRKSESMTQREMANKLKISKSLYQKLEKGDRNVSRKLMGRIKELYPGTNVNIFWLFQLCGG